MEKIEEAVLQIVADHMGVPVSRLSLETRITDDLGGTHLDRMELIMTFEQRFGVAIDREQVTSIDRIGDMVGIVKAVMRDQSVADTD